MRAFCVYKLISFGELYEVENNIVCITEQHWKSLPSRFIFACRLVFYLYACTVENPEIPGFCVSKSRDLRTDHKRVKKIETWCFSVTQTKINNVLCYSIEIYLSIFSTFGWTIKQIFNSKNRISKLFSRVLVEIFSSNICLNYSYINVKTKGFSKTNHLLIRNDWVRETKAAFLSSVISIQILYNTQPTR